MCVINKERIESEALKKQITMKEVEEMYPGIFSMPRVSMKDIRSLATLLNCSVDYIMGADIRSGGKPKAIEVNIKNLNRAISRIPSMNAKTLSYLISGSEWTVYGIRREGRINAEYIKNAAYYLNCSYQFLTDPNCLGIGRPDGIAPTIPENSISVNTKAIVAKANQINMNPSAIGTKSGIGSINGSRLYNGEIKFLPKFVIDNVAKALDCVPAEIISPAETSKTKDDFILNKALLSNSKKDYESYHEIREDRLLEDISNKADPVVNTETSMIPCDDSLGKLTLRDIITISSENDGKFLESIIRLHKLNDIDRSVILDSIEPMLRRFEN